MSSLLIAAILALCSNKKLTRDNQKHAKTKMIVTEMAEQNGGERDSGSGDTVDVGG